MKPTWIVALLVPLGIFVYRYSQSFDIDEVVSLQTYPEFKGNVGYFALPFLVPPETNTIVPVVTSFESWIGVSYTFLNSSIATTNGTVHIKTLRNVLAPEDLMPENPQIIEINGQPITPVSLLRNPIFNVSGSLLMTLTGTVPDPFPFTSVFLYPN